MDKKKKDSHMVRLKVIVYMYFKDHKERTVYLVVIMCKWVSQKIKYGPNTCWREKLSHHNKMINYITIIKVFWRIVRVFLVVKKEIYWK